VGNAEEMFTCACMRTLVTIGGFMNEKTFKDLVVNYKLKLDGATGIKKPVKAYFVLYQGHLQLHFKYGKVFYRFNLEEANELEKDYNWTRNIRL